MSRMARFRAGARRVHLGGLVRVALVAGAAFGIVHVATTETFGVDLVAASGDQPAPVSGTSLATRVTQACPGPELSGIAGVPDVAVPATITAASGPAELLPAAPSGDGSLTAASGATTLLTIDGRPVTQTAAVPKGTPVQLIGEGALAPAVAGTQEWLVDGKDLRGLVSVPCAAGGTDLWLLGGGAGPGRQERLVLTNPGANPVTTEVTVHGSSGQIADPVVETVAPGGRVSVLLDARDADDQQPAVHVHADGGGVQAVLTDTWIVGSTPLGAETTAPAAAPARLQLVPGAVLGEGPAAVRVAVPGAEAAVVRVSILGRGGLVPATGESVLSVGAGSVGELALEGVPAGTYAVQLTSDEPVVASVLSRVGGAQAPREFAWSVASDALTSVGGAAFRPVSTVDRTLNLVSSDGNTDVEVVTVVDGTPRSRRLSLLEDRAATVPLDGASSVWVRVTGGSGQLRGTVLSSTGSGATRMLSSMPLSETVVASAVSRAFPLP